MGVLMDLMPCYGGTTAPRPRKLVDVRYRARGPSRKDLVCVALSYRRGEAVWMGVQRPFWRSETIALLRREGHGRAAERENDPDTTFLDLYVRIGSSAPF